MVPSFFDMVIDLVSRGNYKIYESSQEGEWGVIKDGVFLMTVKASDPSDAFLVLWIRS